MAYRRKSYTRRGRRGRTSRSWYNKKYSTMQLARKAYSGLKIIRGLVNSEMFHKEHSYALGANQSVIGSMTALAQGDGVAARTGNSILAKSLAIKGYFQTNSLATVPTRVLFALVLDKQQISDTAPTLADIFSSATDPDTFLNVNNLGRFTILWRKQYTLMPYEQGNPTKQFSQFTTLNKHIRYNGTADTDIQKNGMYLCTITSEAVEFPIVAMTARLAYHDN